MAESSIARNGTARPALVATSVATTKAGEESRSEKSFGTAPRETKANDEEDDEDVSVGPPGTGAVVDMDVFGQLLEIVRLIHHSFPSSQRNSHGSLTDPLVHQDDDETHEFSKTLAYDYISQADATFSEIDDALYVLSYPHTSHDALSPHIRRCVRYRAKTLGDRGHFESPNH